MRKDLLSVFNYFGYFSYAPSFEEIYTFFPKKITRKQLLSYLARTGKQKKLVRLPSPHHSRYTLPQYSMSRQEEYEEYIDMRIQIYINILKIIPLVRFVGITGKSAVEGPRKNDDIDLFVITKNGCIWTARFIVVILAKILGIHGGNGVCINLFFDESDLTITKIKKNSYIAHEILQMKPLVDKKNIFYAFIETNKWIFKYFPNAQSQYAKRVTQNVKNKKNVTRYTLCEHVEQLLKSIQLPIIKKNKTGFRITNRQLWLFKSDFEAKLKQRGYGKVI